MNVVTDGGFEGVDNDATLTTDVTSGGWTVGGAAYFDYNGSPDGYQTPDDEKFAYVYLRAFDSQRSLPSGFPLLVSL